MTDFFSGICINSELIITSEQMDLFLDEELLLHDNQVTDRAYIQSDHSEE